jgi:hypothetical protein
MEAIKAESVSKPKTYSVDDWKKIIEAHKKSKLTVSDFCVRENINAPRFYAWRSRLSKKGFQSMIVLPSSEQKISKTSDPVQVSKVFIFFLKLWKIEIRFSV